MNNNAVTTAAGNTTKSSELLARYCDALVRKGFVEILHLQVKSNEFFLLDVKQFKRQISRKN